MKVGIMQPYFYPYIGYFILMAQCDKFVLYDDIQYTKKGWINRNKLNFMGNIETVSITLQNSHHKDTVLQKRLSDQFEKNIQKTVRKVELSYRRAEGYTEIWPKIKPILTTRSDNLFDYLLTQIENLKQILEIETKLIKSSTFQNSELRGQERIINICHQLGASEYLNLPGGIALYESSEFRRQNLNLKILEKIDIPSLRYESEYLSILDLLLSRGSTVTKSIIQENIK